MKRLENKIAVITAAGQGIGKATAIYFANEGANVYATDINQTSLDQLKSEFPNVSTHVLDVRNNDAIKTFATTIGGNVDILFNCAGHVHHGTILDCTDDDWEYAFDLNIKSMYRMIKTFLPNMLQKKRGNIINMASVASSIKGVPNRFIYTATKAAVIGLTKSVASDYIQSGIRCNAICPGTIQTPSLEARIAESNDAEKTRQAFIARQPLGRLGTTNEIAALAVYLASDESTYTTGTTQIIDGGWTN